MLNAHHLIFLRKALTVFCFSLFLGSSSWIGVLWEYIYCVWYMFCWSRKVFIQTPPERSQFKDAMVLKQARFQIIPGGMPRYLVGARGSPNSCPRLGRAFGRLSQFFNLFTLRESISSRLPPARRILSRYNLPRAGSRGLALKTVAI